MSGTFIIRPTTLDSGGTSIQEFSDPVNTPFASWRLTGYPGTQIIDVIKAVLGANNLWAQSLTGNTTPVLFDDTLRFGFSGNSIYLDGSPTPINFAGLPAGFTPLTAIVTIDPSIAGSADGTGVAEYTLQQETGNNGTVNTPTYPYDFTFPAPTMLDIVSNGIGLKIHCLTDNGAGDLAEVTSIANFRIEGTYGSGRAFGGSVESSPPIQTGDTITVIGNSSGNTTAGSGNSVGPGTGLGLLLNGKPNPNNPPVLPPINLLFAQKLTITYFDQFNVLQTVDILTTDFIIWTKTKITFLLPDITTALPKVVTIIYVDNGTQFSGSVTLGSLVTIYFVDGTGIYFLNVGKATDTLYVQGSDPIQTVEVNIPDPTIKTAFLP